MSAEFPSDPGPHNEYSVSEVIAIIAPLVPDATAEQITGYVIIAEKADGGISIARSYRDLRSMVILLARTIENIMRVLIGI